MRQPIFMILSGVALAVAGVATGFLLGHPEGPLGHPWSTQLGITAISCVIVGVGCLIQVFLSVRRATEEIEQAEGDLFMARQSADHRLEALKVAKLEIETELAAALDDKGFHEALLRAHCEDSKDGVLLVDEDMRVLACNAACHRILCEDHEPPEPGDNLRMFESTNKTAKDLIKGIEQALNNSNGNIIDLPDRRVVATRLMLKGRLLVKLTATRRRRPTEEVKLILEENKKLLVTSAELESQNAALIESEKFKSDFLARVSHDLRTPLVSIRGYTELIHGGSLGDINEKQLRGLGTMLRNLDRLLIMIDSLLELSRDPDRSRTEITPEPFDLSQLSSDVVELLTPKCNEAGVDLQLRQRTRFQYVKTEPLQVRADRIMLNRILTNLLGNAIKFTPLGGKIRVYLRFADQQEIGDIESKLETAKAREMRSTGQWPVNKSKGLWVLLRVLDTGKGIPHEELDQIFEPWVTARNKAGLGLGLAITDLYVRLHGGFIEVNSEEGAGTVFTLWLPIGENADEMPAPPPSRPRNRQLPPVESYILVVDDEPDILELTASVLSGQAGHNVKTAGDIETMLALIAESQPEAILLDYYLDGVESTEVLKKLKENPLTRKIPVGIVSARTDDKVRDAAREAGAFGCLPKPAGIDDLMDFVQRMLEQANADKPGRQKSGTLSGGPVSRPLSYLSRPDPT